MDSLGFSFIAAAPDPNRDRYNELARHMQERLFVGRRGTRGSGREYSNPTTQDQYETYLDLWQTFVSLHSVVRRHNMPIDIGGGGGGGVLRIPRLVALRAAAEAAQPRDAATVESLDNFEAYHAALWKEMRKTAEALSKDEYLAAFLPQLGMTPATYERALLDSIL